MKAIFETAFGAGEPVLPPMEQLHFVDDQGVLRGGWSCMSEAPAEIVTVLVEASAETIAAMKADPAYTWVEDVAL